MNQSGGLPLARPGEALRRKVADLLLVAQKKCLEVSGVVVDVPRRSAEPKVPPVERRLLTVPEVMGYTGWSLNFVYALINDGLLPVVRIRRSTRIDKEDLDALIARSKVIAAAKAQTDGEAAS